MQKNVLKNSLNSSCGRRELSPIKVEKPLRVVSCTHRYKLFYANQRRRRLLVTTLTELSAIAAAAISGVSRQPVNV